MPNFKLAATMAALMLTVGAAAQAANQPKPNEPKREHPRFEAMDTNHDGGVSLDELKAALAKHPKALEHADQMFQRMDKNKDGKIELKEFQQMHRQHRRHHDEHEHEHQQDKQ